MQRGKSVPNLTTFVLYYFRLYVLAELEEVFEIFRIAVVLIALGYQEMSKLRSRGK